MGDFNKVKYNNEYNKANYKRCIFNVQKGQEVIIEEHFKESGFKSLNSYVNHLINTDMEENEMKLTPEEQLIINMYRYTTAEDQKLLYSTALSIDAKYTQEEKAAMFSQSINKQTRDAKK